MNFQTVREILADLPLRTCFQAALLTAHEGGYTVRELSDQLGVPRSTLHRWLTTARDRSRKIPRVEVTAPADGAYECNHRRLYSDRRRRVCLRCLISNFEASPSLKRDPNFDPAPEPKVRKVYRPGALKGGRS